MRFIASLTLTLTLGSFAAAGDSDVGKTAYPFLKVGVSAKSQAMGGAFVALADDMSSLYYNPAGLTARIYDLRRGEYYLEEGTQALVKQRSARPNKFFATYINYLLDFQSGYLGYARYLAEDRALGFSAQYQNYGSFTALDDRGEPQGTFSAYDMAVGVTYAGRFLPELSFGVTGKVVFEKIEDYSSDALALDAGALYRFEGGRTSLGFAMRNIGTQLKGLTKSHKDPLPLMVSGGISHTLKGLPLTVNADLTYPSDNDVFLSLGGQIEAFLPFAIRLGWTSAGNDYKTGAGNDGLAGFAGGFGYRYAEYEIDYSYSSYADLGQVHRISLGVEF